MKRLVISDTHIGSKYYKAEKLTEFLSKQDYDQLILGGDIIDLIRVPTFTRRAIKILKAIDFSKEIIYVVGNHDISFEGLVGEEIFGVKFVKKYEFEECGRKFRIEHGDQYDTGIVHKKLLIKLIVMLYSILEEWLNINITKWWAERLLKKRKLRRVWDILSWNEDADVIITGHSHCPEAVIWVDENGFIKTYANIGDWVSHRSYIVITDGILRLKTYIPSGAEDEEDLY